MPYAQKEKRPTKLSAKSLAHPTGRNQWRTLVDRVVTRLPVA